MIRLEKVGKVYDTGKVQVHALQPIDLEVGRGEMVAIMGPSGSGKSTLMNILGCLDRPTSGSYWLDGREVARLNANEFAEVRNRKLAFIFQSYNLLPRLTALENTELPLIYRGMTAPQRKAAALSALGAVGLGDRLLRAFFEVLGCQVGWEEATRTVTGSRDGTVVKLAIGNKTAHVNGRAKELAVEPELIEGSTFVPLRFVGEALGATVNWDNGVITVTTTGD